jgi:predicted permease
LTGTLLSALIISASAPTANNTVIFAAKYGRDSVFASKVVAIVSVISIITMPFMIALSSVV